MKMPVYTVVINYSANSSFRDRLVVGVAVQNLVYVITRKLKKEWGMPVQTERDKCLTNNILDPIKAKMKRNQTKVTNWLQQF